MAKVSGVDAHTERLKRMRTKAPAEVAKRLYIAGQEIELEAEHSITDGSISGPGHVVSLPGQPPNADTRLLDGNIETTLVAQNPPTVHVNSNAPYAAPLEFGTSKMVERPYMRPAAQKKRKRVAELVAEAVNVTVR